MKQQDYRSKIAQIVKQIQAGQHDSLEYLIHLVRDDMCSYIFRLTQNRDITEDLAQETFLQILESIHQIKDPDRFLAWLYRTAMGKVQHYYREQKQTQSIRQSQQQNEQELLTKIGKMKNEGLNNLLQKELYRTVRAALSKLSFRHRNILIMRVYQQLPYAVIAESMNCSQLSAQVLFYRAKSNLKRQLKKRGVGRDKFMTALGLFGLATQYSATQASAGVVSCALLQTSTAATTLGFISTTLVSSFSVITAVVTSFVGGFYYVESIDQVQAASGMQQQTLYRYESPSYISHADYQSDGWKILNFSGGINTFQPDKDIKKFNKLSTTLPIPENQSIEFVYDQVIEDGPGGDILITDYAQLDERADVFVTNGQGKKVFLGSIDHSIESVKHSVVSIVIGPCTYFDLSDYDIPFEPKGVSITCTYQTDNIGFKIRKINARLHNDN